MPPKTAATKEKKEQRKKETEVLQARKKLLDDASSADDMLAALPAFRTFKRDKHELDLTISYAKVQAIGVDDMQKIFNLLKANMEQQ
jgi:hypothetical protein